MTDKSLSRQLDDHIAADEEYKVMKQVDREATQAARTDELTWLRELERSVKDIRATDKYSEQMLCVSEVAAMVNQRIMALLSAEVGQLELHRMEQVEQTPEFAAGAGFPIDKTDAWEERKDAARQPGVVWCDRCHAHHGEGTCQ